MADGAEQEYEENSGVEFPGESLEPFISIPQTLEDDTLEQSHVVVEVKESFAKDFAFRFLKN